jgi:hypothetical protein
VIVAHRSRHGITRDCYCTGVPDNKNLLVAIKQAETDAASVRACPCGGGAGDRSGPSAYAKEKAGIALWSKACGLRWRPLDAETWVGHCYEAADDVIQAPPLAEPWWNWTWSLCAEQRRATACQLP